MANRESEIIELLKKRDEQGLSLLYDHYAAALNGLIWNILKSTPVSEEVLQQTFLKIWNNIDSYNSNKSSLFTWMSTIARNTAIDKKRLKSFERNEKTESLDINVHQVEATKIPTENIDVENLLKLMDPKYKSVLDHIYLQGYSHKEAAEVLEIPIGTVKTRLRMAISELREKLTKEKKLFFSFLLIIICLILLMI